MDNAFREKIIEVYKLLVARSDVTAALDACDLMLKHVKDFLDDYKHGLYGPFLNAIIICYARPFTRNKPFGSLGEEWKSFSNAKHQQLHEDLIKYRDTMVAHSDFEIRKVVVYPNGVEMEGLSNYKSIGVSATVSTKALTLEHIKDIRELCFDLGKRINEEVDIRLKELFGDESVPKMPIDLGEILGIV